MKSNPSRTLFRTLFATGLLAAGLCSCCPKHNTLTQAEIADGWQLLFDGKSLDQWKDFNGDSLTMPWHVVDPGRRRRQRPVGIHRHQKAV